VGRKDIEDALKRLDRLTQDEALMAAAQILNRTYQVDKKVAGVGNKLNDVDDKMGVVVQGMPRVEHSSTIHPILIAPMLARWKGCEGDSSANIKQRR
jgi:hypothetical protein